MLLAIATTLAEGEPSVRLAQHKTASAEYACLAVPTRSATSDRVIMAVFNMAVPGAPAREFSALEEEEARILGVFVSGVLPYLQLDRARRIAERLITLTSLSGEDERARLYAFITGVIPGIKGVALARTVRDAATPEILSLGGDLSDPPLDNRELLDVNRVPRLDRISIRIPATELPSHLLIDTDGSTLDIFQRQILTDLAQQFSHILTAEKQLAEVVEVFVQIRHAVRSGLTGVVGYVHEALGCFEAYRQMDFAPSVLSQARFRKALQRANFAAAKTQALLEESRFLLGRIARPTLRLGHHSISDVVRHALDALRPAADERNIELSYNNRLQAHENRAVFDRPLIELLVFNLVDNAIKYSFRNRVVAITLSSAKGRWRLDVTDSGVYIRPDDVDIIFQPFTRRVSGRFTDGRPGTGLGLAVAREIVTAHGGKIGCSSKKITNEMAETTFNVELPKHLEDRK